MFNVKDTEILRCAAGQVREIAELPVMAERQSQWTALNDLKGKTPMILVSPEGAWKEIDVTFDLQCTDPAARQFELQLRRTIFQHEGIGDDSVITADFDIPWQITDSGFGVELKRTLSDTDGGSFKHVPAFDDLSAGLRQLRQRQITVKRQETENLTTLAQEAFGDLLFVRNRGSYLWTTGTTNTVMSMIGMEAMMLYMFDDPDGLKALLQFLAEEKKNYLLQLENLGILSSNNAGCLIGSGHFGFTGDLPAAGAIPYGQVRLNQTWGLCEAQETVGISPEMFGEFFWPFQKPLMEMFGLTYYGCCEPVEDRFQYIRQVKNLRCISVSPWSNVEKCAALYGRDYVLGRKPNPGLVCVNFAEDAIRRELRHTLTVAGELNLAFVLKDTHTISNEPERLKRWVKIVREEIARR